MARDTTPIGEDVVIGSNTPLVETTVEALIRAYNRLPLNTNLTAGDRMEWNGTAWVPVGKDTSPTHLWVPAFVTPATQVNWTTLSATSGRWLHFQRTSSGVQNDEIAWDLEIQAGTWTFGLLHFASTDRGVYHVHIDGTEVGTIDGYRSAAQNLAEEVTGITVASTATQRVLLRMETKNASSSGFFGNIQALWLTKTA